MPGRAAGMPRPGAWRTSSLRRTGRDYARAEVEPAPGAAFVAGRWIAALRRITTSRSGDWARRCTTQADA